MIYLHIVCRPYMRAW